MRNLERQRDKKMLAKCMYLRPTDREKLNRSVGRPDEDRSSNYIEQQLKEIVKAVKDLLVELMNRKDVNNELSEDLEEMANINKIKIRAWLDFEVSAEYEELHQTEALENVETFCVVYW